MSGIFGAIGESWVHERVLARLGDVLSHRGPDDAGSKIQAGAGIGCRLLRTAGSSEPAQPVTNARGDVWAVLDGAIYNRERLWGDLTGQRGRAVPRGSDAELLIALYEEDGAGLAARLRGAFAFAIWDARARRLLLARDHLGHKPLFYREVPGGGLIFASEIKGLIAGSDSGPAVDYEALSQYLSMRFVMGDRSMLRGIKKLPPATTLTYECERISTSRYWRLSFAEKLLLSHDEYIDGLERKLEETVASHMSPDGATGAFLSGGLDSSLVVAMMARASSDPVTTFCIGFGEKEFDETPYARIVAEVFGTRQIEEHADGDLITMLPTMIHGLDEPSDLVAVSFFMASHLAARHVKVALGGDGGDELFAGTDRYRGILLARRLSRLPAFVRNSVLHPLIAAVPPSFGYNSLGLQLRWLERMAGLSSIGDSLRETISFFRFRDDEKEALLTDETRRQIGPGSATDGVLDLYEESDAEHVIERMLYVDFCTKIPEHLLMLVDRMGMVNGLEVRSPLLDTELVEYLARFPLGMKIRRGKNRYAQRLLADKLLPREIARRKKRGFRPPLAAWFAGELQPFMRGVLSDSALAADGIFVKDYMLRLLDEHVARRYDHNWKLWMLLNLEIWHRMVVKGAGLGETQEWIASHASRRNG